MTKPNDFYEQMVERNIGVISEKEQERLRNACVAVAGCGGIGGLSAEQLVRIGVGHVKIADPDTFAVHNLSRQSGSTSANIGQNKADVLGRHFKSINPTMQLDIFREGVLPENTNKFLEGAEAVVDGTDYSNLEATVHMYRSAREKGLCVFTPNAIGFGVNVFVFGPDTISLEDHLELSSGIDPRMALLKLVPYLPPYLDPEIVQKAASGETHIPNIAMPQYLATSIAVSEIVMMLLGRIKPPAGPDPRIFILDLLNRKFSVTG
ncbi:MAG: ThiF family adenylyltransferase [Candidatus Omnitrophica bacterium]|nr:ThiF family adenylyltransferase [Candidatus Omnitrophota bacterium]MBU1894461.1 ThiF family adenylyltransferase [Candidatus Omnitrophota bacterium]